MTPVFHLGAESQNQLFVKREDFIPFSFGGNKARKAELFFQEVDRGGFDAVVTYGSGSSNHCRVIANQCCQRGIPCIIVSPEEEYTPTFNSRMTEIFGAERIVVPLDQVHETMVNAMGSLRRKGHNPYLIEGGGHGILGTEAYVRCYREIVEQEQSLGVYFDYIFHASGTGTTQAGLICGQLLAGDTQRKIVGISIARKNPRGRNVVLDSVRSYLRTVADESAIQAATIFTDRYTSGYGHSDEGVRETIDDVLKHYGLPLDVTYTGKAFWGMKEWLREQDIRDQNVLFLHTGGTPLFFDSLR